ncbi:hypothetical protein FRC03_003966 [Tulasnella sp. 419]|nr:hypothetical protein FRC03_003966 [Tulasnella sp. 419]
MLGEFWLLRAHHSENKPTPGSQFSSSFWLSMLAKYLLVRNKYPEEHAHLYRGGSSPGGCLHCVHLISECADDQGQDEGTQLGILAVILLVLFYSSNFDITFNSHLNTNGF